MSKYQFLLKNPDALPKGVVANEYYLTKGKDTTFVRFTGDTLSHSWVVKHTERRVVVERGLRKAGKK